jgi:hypothetical protein
VSFRLVFRIESRNNQENPSQKRGTNR